MAWGVPPHNFMSNFREKTLQWPQNGCPKKFQTLKYEHIAHSFEARALEILNMYLLSRNI